MAVPRNTWIRARSNIIENIRMVKRVSRQTNVCKDAGNFVGALIKKEYESIDEEIVKGTPMHYSKNVEPCECDRFGDTMVIVYTTEKSRRVNPLKTYEQSKAQPNGKIGSGTKTEEYNKRFMQHLKKSMIEKKVFSNKYFFSLLKYYIQAYKYLQVENKSMPRDFKKKQNYFDEILQKQTYFQDAHQDTHRTKKQIEQYFYKRLYNRSVDEPLTVLESTATRYYGYWRTQLKMISYRPQANDFYNYI